MGTDQHILTAWRKLAATPGGKRVFSRLVCTRAPYFAGIRPVFEVVEAGHVEVSMHKRHAILGRDTNVHTMAMATLAELAARIVTQASLPDSHDCRPCGSNIEHLHTAYSDLTALAHTHMTVDAAMPTEHDVDVDIRDTGSRLVCRARITLRITPKRRGSAHNASESISLDTPTAPADQPGHAATGR